MTDLIPTPKKILVIHHWGRLGDAIIFAATTDKLSQLYPEAEITWIGSKKAKALRPLLPNLKEAYFVSCSEHADIKQKWQRLLINLKEAFALIQLVIELTQKNNYDMVLYPKRMALFKVMLLPVLATLNIPVRIGFDDGRFSSTFFTHTVPDTTTSDEYIANNYLKLLQPITGNTVTYQAPHLTVDPDTAERVNQRLSQMEPSDTNLRIVLHPGVGQNINNYYQKAWPLSHWQNLLVELLKDYPGSCIYLSGGPDDVETIAALEQFIQTLPVGSQRRILNLASLKLGFDEYAAAIWASHLVVVADTGILHLAMGLGIPTVTIFTSTSEKLYTYETESVSVVARNDLSCRPCLWVYRANTCETPECLNVPVTEVKLHIAKLLNKRAMKPVALSDTVYCEL